MYDVTLTKYDNQAMSTDQGFIFTHNGNALGIKDKPAVVFPIDFHINDADFIIKEKPKTARSFIRKRAYVTNDSEQNLLALSSWENNCLIFIT